MNKIAVILGVGVLSISCFGAAKEKPPPPQPMTYTVPAAAAPGKTTRVIFRGAVSGKGVDVWTNFGAEVKGAEGDAAFDLTVPEATPVGIYAMRLMTTAGVSNLQLFMVDDLATVEKSGKNNSAERAQAVSLPVAVEGACEALASDYYAFDAKAGERVTFDMVAQRLGSKLDPMLRVLDAGGREVAYCDDTPGLGGDIRFAHTFEAAGRYVVELRDADYEGGSEFRYRLRMGGFPAATVAFPVAGKRGAMTSFEPAEIGREVYKPFEVQVGEAARQNVGLWMKSSGSGSGFVSIVTSDSPDIVGGDENHTVKSAMKIKAPAAISGRFLTVGVRDYYAIEAKKGERYSIRARTRSVNSPCDLYLQFLKPDGSKMAESKAVAADEGEMEVLIPADGAYRLAVEDMGRGAGAAYVYRVEIARVLPGFSLSAESDRLNGVTGGVVKLKVKSSRRDFDGPVTLSLSGEAKDFELKNEVIEKGKTETELEIKIPEGKEARVIGLRVNGAAMVGSVLQVERVSTMGFLKTVFPRMAYPPVELDGEIGLGVRAK
jgi:hypothetical protein